MLACLARIFLAPLRFRAVSSSFLLPLSLFASVVSCFRFDFPQRQSDFVRTGLQQRSRLQRIGPDRKPEQYKAGNQENRKEDAGDGGGARRLQPRTDQGCFLLHLTLTIAAGNCILAY